MKARTRITRIIPALLLICGIFLSLLLSACGESKKDAVLPPVRMIDLPAEGCLDSNVPTSIIEAIAKSDTVAYVRVGDWLGESASKTTTLYSTQVIETVKGELPSKFTLLQEGTSDFIYRNYPLFTHGNELLLFLQKISDENREFDKLPQDSYKITGTYTTVMDVITMDGEKYAIPRCYALLETMPSTVKNLAADEAFLTKAVDELRRCDSVWKEITYKHNHVYKLNELISMIKAG